MRLGGDDDDDDDDPSEAFARSTDPDTSHKAAEDVGRRVSRLEKSVASAIKMAGRSGATWDEIAKMTGIDKASVSPRFKPLRRKKLIEFRIDAVTGKKIVRLGKSKSSQTVWFTRPNK